MQPDCPPTFWWRLGDGDAPAEPRRVRFLPSGKLAALGIHGSPIRHKPREPERHRLLAWLPAVDWPLSEREQAARQPWPRWGDPFGLALPRSSGSRKLEEDLEFELETATAQSRIRFGERLLIPAGLAGLAEEFASRDR